MTPMGHEINHLPPPAENPRGDGRLSSSFRCAFAGIAHVLRSQRNARIHLGVTAAVALLGWWLRLTYTEWAIIALTVAVVLVAEMLNTAAEAAIDLVTDHYHPLAKVAKDVAAGAVLTAAIIAVIVGLLVLGPHLIQRVAPLVR